MFPGLRSGTMSRSKVATGAPSMTAATPPTRTKRTRWLRSVARTAAKSVGCRGTAAGGQQVDVILQDGQALRRRESCHPADERQVDAVRTDARRARGRPVVRRRAFLDATDGACPHD